MANSLIACNSLIYVCPNYKYLIVSVNETGKGNVLPGGKWELGETFKQTAARELKEETGLIATKQKLIFHGMSINGYYLYTFLTEIKRYSPTISNVELVGWDELCKSIYAPYMELLKDVYLLL